MYYRNLPQHKIILSSVIIPTIIASTIIIIISNSVHAESDNNHNSGVNNISNVYSHNIRSLSVADTSRTKVSSQSGAATLGKKAFFPNPVIIRVGETKTWTNDFTGMVDQHALPTIKINGPSRYDVLPTSKLVTIPYSVSWQKLHISKGFLPKISCMGGSFISNPTGQLTNITFDVVGMNPGSNATLPITVQVRDADGYRGNTTLAVMFHKLT